MKTKLFSILALLLMAATGAWAQEQWDAVWDFTSWSTETVSALKADAAASKLVGWSDVELKRDAEKGANPKDTDKDNIFWYTGTVNEDGSLSANGVVIKELQGLKFNPDYTTRRQLAIAVNYPNSSLGEYDGPAYLRLGGKLQTCFTIPGVKAGSMITIVVESQKPSEGRGIGLYKNSYAAENLIGEQFKPTTIEEKTWEIAEDCDVVVLNTNVCHIYSIKVKSPATPAGNSAGLKEGTADAGYSIGLKEGTEDADQWTVKVGTGEAQTLPVEGLEGGETITLTYSGTKKVKSIKAVEIAAPATDLSMVDCAGNERTDGQWTANCYMVHTAGRYKLPLVYGNAIKNGETNEAAYTGVTGNSNATATFPRHDGQAITAPWIKDNGITVTSAELLWQDAQGLITAVGISDDYLTLTVGKDATEQEGNALVAAKDASGAIVWSWHIWVTKQTFASTDLTTVNTGSHTYTVTPVNLGWVGDVKSKGYHTYYQWGRKDAFIPSTGTNMTNPTDHTVYDINGTEVTGLTYSGTLVDIADNIKNPTTFYNWNNSPYSSTVYNLWDAQQTAGGDDDIIATATKKTVYDPSPAGFCVPTSNLLNYIYKTYLANSSAWDDTNLGRIVTSVTPNLFFPVSTRRYISDGALSSVSSGFYWTASPNKDSYAFILRVWGPSSNSIWGWGNASRSQANPVRAVAEE